MKKCRFSLRELANYILLTSRFSCPGAPCPAPHFRKDGKGGICVELDIDFSDAFTFIELLRLNGYDCDGNVYSLPNGRVEVKVNEQEGMKI